MEHVSTTTLIIILIGMIFASAYFSGTETSMMTINRYRLRHAAKQGNRSAKRVEKLLQRPDRLISLVLIGNNLINIVASALATIVGMRLYGDAGVAIATGVLTFVILIFAEVLPNLSQRFIQNVSLIQVAFFCHLYRKSCCPLCGFLTKLLWCLCAFSVLNPP